MSDVEGRLIRKYASLIMALATVVPPYAIFLNGFGGYEGHMSVDVTTYALFWAIYPPASGVGGLHVLTYVSLTSSLSLGFFNIIFAFQVIRYIKGKTRKKSTLVAGALTLVLPIISLLAAWPVMISLGFFVYIGPIPIQLATGLLLMHLAGPKEITSPW